MTAKDRFTHHYLHAAQNTEFTWQPSVTILGHLDYDQLFSEISTSVADFMSVEQSQISLELQRKHVPHFYFRGILVLRSLTMATGFYFA